MLILLIALVLGSCGMDVDVSDSQHRVTFEVCDKETWPVLEERQACIKRVLDILD